MQWHTLTSAFRVGRTGQHSPSAVCLSALLHACAIGVLGLWAFDPSPNRGSYQIQTVWAQPEQLTDSLANVTAATDEVTANVGGASLGTLPLQIGARERVPSDVVVPDEPVLQQLATATGSQSLAETVLPVGGGDGDVDTAGDGQGSGNGVGDGSGTSFFGLDSTGKKFVFVVDASGSMRRPFEGPGNTLLGRVKLELVRCVTQMSADQEFFIVFFNDDAIPMPATELIKATPEAQKHFLYWMARTKAGGNTEPEAALRIAMQLQPDVVYFLTDGAFKYRVIEHVRELNRSRVTVHTVSFGGDERATDFMEQIASQNGGTFHYVSPEGEQATEETAAASDKGTVTRAASVPVE
jgi:hypothetical protein